MSVLFEGICGHCWNIAPVSQCVWGTASLTAVVSIGDVILILEVKYTPCQPIEIDLAGYDGPFQIEIDLS